MEKLNVLKKLLLQIVNNIDTGNTNLGEEECENIINMINHTTNVQTKYSKYKACNYLHMSRATFDNWVKSGKIPKGQKQQGFKELFWTLDDLKRIKHDIKNKINSH